LVNNSGSEPLARRSNREDGSPGRFWQGRFRSVRLCSEAAILACSMYVDLNLIRAALAQTPETSDHTSAQRRIQGRQAAMTQAESPIVADGEAAVADGDALSSASLPDAWLAPIPLDEALAPAGPQGSSSSARCSDKGCLPLSLDEYLELLDWTGRQLADGKRGVIPGHLEPILERLDIPTGSWLDLAQNFGRLFERIAGGCHSQARQRRNGRPFRCRNARLLGAGR
jgi:hypothetical protein